MAKHCDRLNYRPAAGWRRVRTVLVLGAQGMLGRDVCRMLAGVAPELAGDRRVIAWGHDDLDITREQNVCAQFEKERPDLVINCAAYTDVDGSEKNAEIAFAVNAEAPRNVARACVQVGAKLVHISTDFIFDGRTDRLYLEDDSPNALNVYGASKLAGEEHLRNVMPCDPGGNCQHLIVRTAWLFGIGGRNFVKTIANAAQQRDHLDVVDDQTGCPTYSVDLAEALGKLVALEAGGTYHFSNAGHCSWFEFAREIVRQTGRNCEVRPATSEALARPAKRPSRSVLDISKYTNITGTTPRSWQNALQAYLAQTD